MPQVVDPAHPPINIKKRKNIKGKFPHKLKLEVTYPVPDKIETTLNAEILKLSNTLCSLLFNKRYKNINKTDNIKM